MSHIVHGHETRKAQDKQDGNGSNKPRPQFAHVTAASLGSDGNHRSNESKQGTACSQGKVPGEGAQQETENAGYNVEKEIARRSIKLFQRGAELHQRHHVESDVDEPGMKKHRRHQAPPFMVIENEKWVEHAEADLRLTDKAPQN